MFETDILVLAVNTRGRYFVEDTAYSAKWGCGAGDCRVVIVEGPGELQNATSPPPPWCSVVEVPTDSPDPIWRALATLRGMVEADAVFNSVLILRDHTILVRPSMGEWLRTNTVHPDMGVLGVGRSHVSQASFLAATELFYRWNVPHQAWEQPPPTLCDSALALPGPAVARLFSMGLLFPKEFTQFPGDGATYLSWICPMVGLAQACWGYDYKYLPPLYIAENTPGKAIMPQALSDLYALYAPTSAVSGYAEQDIREIFKHLRGEPSRPFPPFGAVVTVGPPD